MTLLDLETIVVDAGSESATAKIMKALLSGDLNAART